MHHVCCCSSAHPSIGALLRRGVSSGVGVQVIYLLGSFVLRNQIRDNLSRLIKLTEVVGERGCLLILLEEGVAFTHAVVLLDDFSEELDSQTCLKGNEQAGDVMLLSERRVLLTVAMLV